MTIQIKHAFVSLKGDGTDATQVQPTAWNAAHAFTMATGNLIGRLSAGAGNAEEIALSAYMASLLNTPDKATLAGILGLFETGDTKWTFKTTASAGWVLLNLAYPNNTIGKTGSGATARANDDTYDLYALIYAACSDAIAPVAGGRSGNALTDFNAGKIMYLNMLVGRSPMGAGGAGSGLTARTLGQVYGEENHTLSVAEIASHYHAAGIYDPSHVHTWTQGAPPYNANGTSTGGGAFAAMLAGSSTTINYAATGVRVNSGNGIDTTYSAGGSTAHNTVHPVVGLNAMVKL